MVSLGSLPTNLPNLPINLIVNINKSHAHNKILCRSSVFLSLAINTALAFSSSVGLAKLHPH